MRLALALVMTLCSGCIEHAATEHVAVDAGPADNARTTVTDAALPRAVAAGTRAIDEPPVQREVAVTASVRPTVAGPGETVAIAVCLKIAATWHVQGLGPSAGPGQPTRLELSLPDGWEAASEWTAPAADLRMSALGLEFVYHDEATFQCSVRIPASALPGRMEATCLVTYQACNPSRCLPPTTTTIAVPLDISRN